MARFVTTVPSQRSQADAFAYLADFENAREWDPSVTEAHRITDGPLGVGAEFAVVSKFGPRQVSLRYRIVRYEPDRLVVLEARSKGFVSTDTITVEAAGDTSRVTYDAVLAFGGLGRLADPLMQVVFNRVGRKAEARLREVL
jgi:Polyketide cyclase / dehydrase and lipid transport